MKAPTRAYLCSLVLFFLAFFYLFQGGHTVANIFIAAGFVVIALAPEKEKG